jgi:hypothetical protein
MARGRPRRPSGLAVIRLLVGLVLLVAPLMAGELWIRGLIRDQRLPIAASHSGLFDQMWHRLHVGRAPEVLILGDSVTQQDVDPATLAELVKAERGTSIRVFNAASAAAGFSLNRAILEQLIREGRAPKVIVVGVSTNSLEGDGAFLRDFAPSPLGGMITRCAETTSIDGWLSCRLANVSALWRWHGRLDRVAFAVDHALPVRVRSASFVLRADGYGAWPPATLDTIRGQVDRALSHEPETLRLAPGVPDAFKRLVDVARGAGIPIVAVAMPTSPIYQDALEARSPGYDAGRRDGVAVLAAASGQSIIDPLRFGSWWGDGSSRDVKHLSLEGAPKFVEQLWAMPAFRDGVLAGFAGGN